MKKTIRKILALCLSLIMVMTLCLCLQVSAATDLSTLTADNLCGKQVPTAITTDLTLPGDVSWESSNTGVISNKGIVTRPVSEDVTVTLTATSSSGIKKSFDFTVKAKNKKVIAQDNFNYSELESVQGTTSFYPTMGNDWAISAAAPNSKIKTDFNGNRYLEADMSAASTQLLWRKSAEGDVLYLNFDAMRANAGNTVSLQAYVTGKDATGNPVTRLLRLAVFYDGKIHWGNNGYGKGTTEVDSEVMKPVAIKLDLANKKIYGSYNNGAWTEVDGTDTTYGTAGSGDNRLLATDTITGLSYIRFLAQSTGAANIMLDNFVLSADAELTASVLNFDMLTTQSSYGVTKNLDFAEANAQIVAQGGTVTWSSSNTEVLSISGEAGIINRPVSEAENVTLIATVAKNGKVTTKEIEFTVLPTSTYLIESEGFGRTDMVGKDLNTLGGPWANSTITATEANKLSGSIGAHNDGYSYDLVKSGYTENYMSAVARYDFTAVPETKVLRVAFNVILGKDEIDSTMPNHKWVYTNFFLYGADSNGVATGSTINELWTWSNPGTTTHTTASANSSASLYPKTANDDETVRYEYVYDFENHTFTVYQNGIEAQSGALDDTVAGLSKLCFNIRREGGSGSCRFDDFVVTTQKSDMVTEDLTSDSIGSLKIKVDGSKKQIDITSRYDEENTLTQSFYVRTDTNQHIEYIDQYLTDIKGNKTILWEKDNYYRNTYPNDESAPLLINYRYFGGNHSTGCALVTSVGHGKTLADVGTMWKAADGKKWVLAQITDVNRIKFVCAEELPWGSFELERAINGGGAGTLTRLENGVVTSDTFNYTSQSGNQLFPIVRNSQQTVLVYKADGSSVPVDLGASQSLAAEKVVITDSYDITDPTEVAMSLYNNRPEGGYTETNLPEYAPGETVVAYKQIITIMNDGTVLTEFDHEVKQDIKQLTYFGVQYYMRNNLGGGVKRLMPGTKAFSATRSIYVHRDSISEDTSKEYEFDFSVPAQLYREEKGLAGTPQEHYMFNLPHYKAFNNTVWADETVVPSRVIDYMYDSDNNSDISYAVGFLPIMDAAPSERLKNTTVSFDVDGKAKAYPYLIQQSAGTVYQDKLKAGARIQGVAYRKFEDADCLGGKASIYSVPYGSNEYYYVDFLETGTISFAVAGATEENVIVSQNIGDAVVSVANGKVTVTGDAKDCVELIVPNAGEVSVLYSQCDVSGLVSAEISNSGAEEQVATVICAGYKDSKLIEIEIQSVTLLPKNISVVKFAKDFSNADAYSIYLINEMDELKPLCKTVRSAGLNE